MSTKLEWLAGTAIVIVTLIAFHPALSIGFWTDDFWYVEMVGRLSVPEYLRTYFDPTLQWRWYRPLQGIQWWIEYAFLRGEPVGYHLIQILLHTFSALLLFFLTMRVTRKLGVGLLAALIYLTISGYVIAVFQPSVVDPLLAPFYLLTIWLWLNYLERGGVWRHLCTLGAFVAALMTKEVAVTLPATLVLAELWLLRKRFALMPLLQRYAVFFLLLIPYAVFEMRALSQGVFTQQLGYGPGVHILSSLAYHITLLAFPWTAPSDPNWWLVLIAAIGVAFVLLKRKWRILFVVVTMLFTLLPILPFPPSIARNPRYLYLPFMGSAIIFALLVDQTIGATRRARPQITAPIVCAIIACLIAWSNTTVAEAANTFGGTARMNRLMFRPIYDKHPSFAPGTLLYFLAPRNPNVSGIMFLRYGKEVAVSGTDAERVVAWRNYPTAYILFQDDENNWHEQIASRTIDAGVTAVFPARFGDTILLEESELVSDQVRRGDSLIALVFWRAQRKIDRDYTVFAHLVDPEGRVIASVDRPPQEGNAPTSGWSLKSLVPDGIVLPIPMDASLGKDLKLEIGLYDSETQERLPVLDSNGKRVEDKIVIAPIRIIE